MSVILRHRVRATPLRIACLQRGWLTGQQISTGLGVSTATVGRALRGDPVGEQFIAACSAAFGSDSYPEIFEVVS